MIWIDSIYELQYYKQSKELPCYCEELVHPNDMQLQGSIYNGNGSYTLTMYVYSADGLVQYENATSYFEQYFAVMPNGTHFFNARLKSFSPAMCGHKCFIVRAVVTQGSTVLFDKYTERYCQSSCCDVARGITYSQDGIATTGSTTSPVPAAPAMPITSECGEPLIRIISLFDCMDNFSGDFYGVPGTVLSGTASFGFTKITSCKGRIVRRPREIKREISYNCKLQRSESAAAYLLEGFEYFPAWKMAEIENQLHANHIWIDDYKTYTEYQYEGGTAFKQVHNCFEMFKLEAVLQGCTQRQVFGCETCSTFSAAHFVIGEGYSGGSFYSESGQLIAQDYDELLVWFGSQDGVAAVADVDVETIGCAVYAVISVSGNGYIPASIYFDKAIARNRVFALYADNLDNICDVVGTIPCRKPVHDIVIVETFVCATPVNDTVVIEAMIPTALTISNYGAWTTDAGETTASIYANEVTLSISSANTGIIAEAGTQYMFSGEIIGTISSGGRPTFAALLDHNNNGVLPADSIMVIESTGAIRFTGSIIIDVTNEATITFENLTYNI